MASTLERACRPAAQKRTAEPRFLLSVAPSQRPTEAKAEAAVPEAFALAAAYPNPFATHTTLRYALPEAAHVRIAVYDALGRRVAGVLDEHVGPGNHEVVWTPAHLRNGVYTVQMQAGAHRLVQRLTVIR